jgi:hypothetical protein
LLRIYRKYLREIDSSTRLIDLCEAFDVNDLWIDPDPNAQLILIWLLDYFRAHETIMRSISAGVFATMFLLSSINVGFAQQECTQCQQNHQYLCTQNYGQCMSACRGIGTTDRDACQRRCSTRDQGCRTRAAAKCGTCLPGPSATPPPPHIQ